MFNKEREIPYGPEKLYSVMQKIFCDTINSKRTSMEALPHLLVSAWNMQSHYHTVGQKHHEREEGRLNAMTCLGGEQASTHDG
jgi:hypothetical protein